MNKTILEGLALVDATGLAILATTLVTLALGIVANLSLRARYAGLENELKRPRDEESPFSHAVLRHIVRAATEASYHSAEPNTQAIIEDHFQSELRSMLFAERFARAATGLVIILGLLGTFYGLTLSIGKIVHLVSAESGAVGDVTQGVAQGLTQALSGMAVAFSNSLVGIGSAVILTVLGVLSNVADKRTAVMVQIETYLDRLLSQRPATRGGDSERLPGLAAPGFGDSVARLEATVGRFEAALQAFAGTTRDFHEFNAHLKDNVQRMSLAFGDLSDTLKTQIRAIKPGSAG
jgi:hypothetical protein